MEFQHDPAITILCGEKLFEGAQASIYKYAGAKEGGIDASILLDTDALGISPAATSSTSGEQMPPAVGSCVVKVMGSKQCQPGGLADALVGKDQLVEQDEFLATYHAAREATEIMHPNMIPYLLVEVDSTETCLMMVMPLLAGDLLKWVAARGKKVSEESLLHIADQLCSAVHHLHSINVWHLDLSLRNVLVSSLSEELPKCMIIDTESSTLGDRPPSGHYTFEYSAPERAERPSAKCDVFSMGMLLFAAGARHDCPGLVENVPGLGTVTMNYKQLTPTRIAAVVRRDLDHCESLVSLVTMMLNQDPTTRPSMSFVLENIRALKGLRGHTGVQSLLSFPYVCGPFDLHCFSIETVRRCDLHTKSGMYDLHLSCSMCGLHRSQDTRRRSDCPKTGMVHLPGHMSPYCPNYVFPTAEKQVGLIRGNAQRSAGQTSESALASNGETGVFFLYPMGAPDPASGSAASYHGAINTPEALIQTNGGFAFTTQPSAHGELDETPEPCNPPFNVVSLCPRGAQLQGAHAATFPSLPLFFTAAQPWPSECTAELNRAGRIHQEVPAMLSGALPQGHNRAQAFCWLLPGEAFSLKNGESWVPSDDGGFVFWFGDDPLIPNEMDRYFAVAPSAAAMHERVKSASEITRGEDGVGSGARSGAAKIGRALVNTSNSVMTAVGSALSGTINKLVSNGPHYGPNSKSGPQSQLQPSSSQNPQQEDNIAIYYQLLPTGIRNAKVKVEVAPAYKAPVSWSLPSTSEFGQCSAAVYITAAKAKSLGAPTEAKYMCFARVDDSSLRSRQRRRAESGSPTTDSSGACGDMSGAKRFLPQHGFLLLNMKYEVVAVLSLRITTSLSVSADLKREATRMDLVGMPSLESFDCELPPAELVEVECKGGRSEFDREDSSHSAGSESGANGGSSPWTLVSAGGLGYIGWNASSATFYLSDAGKSSWLVRQWSSLK